MEIDWGNLKAAVVYGAARGVKPVTARAWANADNPLIFGLPRPGSHPIYGLADVCRLIVMQHLTYQLDIGAATAIRIANSIDFDAAIEENFATNGAAVGQCLTIDSRFSGISSRQDPAAIAGAGLIAINPSRVVTMARHRVARIVAGEMVEAAV